MVFPIFPVAALPVNPIFALESIFLKFAILPTSNDCFNESCKPEVNLFGTNPHEPSQAYLTGIDIFHWKLK